MAVLKKRKAEEEKPYKYTEQKVQMILFNEYSGRRMVIPNYTPPDWFECDVLTVTPANYTYEFEIKLSVADFKNDKKKHKVKTPFGNLRCAKNVELPEGYSREYKHQAILDKESYCPNYFSYVVPEHLTEKVRPLLFDNAGLFQISKRGRWFHVLPIVYPTKLHKDKTMGEAATYEQLGKMYYYRMWSAKEKVVKLTVDKDKKK